MEADHIVTPACCQSCGVQWVHHLGISGTCRDLLASKAIARELLAALVTFVEVSKHAHKRWDSNEDSKVGKLLSAMSGYLTGYRYDITAIHAAIEKAKAAIGEVQSIPNEVPSARR